MEDQQEPIVSETLYRCEVHLQAFRGEGGPQCAGPLSGLWPLEGVVSGTGLALVLTVAQRDDSWGR